MLRFLCLCPVSLLLRDGPGRILHIIYMIVSVTTKTDRFVEHLFEYFQQRRKKCFKMFACLLNNPYLCIVNPSLNKRWIACIMVSLIFVLALPVALARCVVVAACAFRGLVTGSPRRAGCMAGSARPAQSSARLLSCGAAFAEVVIRILPCLQMCN